MGRIARKKKEPERVVKGKNKLAVGNPKEKIPKKVAKSKKLPKKASSKKELLENLKDDILQDVDITLTTKSDAVAQILFRLPVVGEPLMGTPKQVQKSLDNMAKKMQSNGEDDPDNEEIFKKIHLYMHGYLINVVLKKFPYIKGYQSVDIYQETLIALRFKAIPGFKKHKGMSFLNFAKLCIRRHLITKLNASINRGKDKAINQSVSLDSPPSDADSDSKYTYANTIADEEDSSSHKVEYKESYEITRNSLLSELSPFEQVTLGEYLSGCQYREIAKNVSKKMGKRYNAKSIDNALLRIRKKAERLLKMGRMEDIPLFMK